MLSYLKYKKYYDRKAAPLKINDYCYILNPKADNQSTKFAFQDCIWTGPYAYVVIKVLSNNNYTIRKIGTSYTQTQHRIRIRPYMPEQRVPDVTVRAKEYLPHPDVKVAHNEWYAVAWEMNFGKQSDEHETPEAVENKTQAEAQEVANTNDETTTQQTLEN